MTFELAQSLQDDLISLYAVYVSRTRRDEDTFRMEFRSAVRSIEASPRQHSPVEDECPGWEVREYYIERFSQRVVYFIEDNRVVVFALLHTSRRPGAWHRRLDTLS